MEDKIVQVVANGAVMVVNRDRQNLLRLIPANHVIGENLADVFRRGNAVARFTQRGTVATRSAPARMSSLIRTGDFQ
jgi:hypothetical protein